MLLGGFELLEAVVVAGLLEDVDGGLARVSLMPQSVGSAPMAKRDDPAGPQAGAT